MTKFSLKPLQWRCMLSTDSSLLQERMIRTLPPKIAIPSVKRVILVGSGKGGVGKSTISVNLAISMARKSFRIGLLDADIYGPSIPRMMNLLGNGPTDASIDEDWIIPKTNFGIECASMGFLVDSAAPIVWRGLMIMKAMEKMLFRVRWSTPLDVLIIDLPPGTGDTVLTIAQRVAVWGAFVVCTPNLIAFEDVRRAVAMFTKVGIPILGIVENMSKSKEKGREAINAYQISMEQLCLSSNVEIVSKIPHSDAISDGTDLGRPVAMLSPTVSESQEFANLASYLIKKM